jgi:hypothetical protein
MLLSRSPPSFLFTLHLLLYSIYPALLPSHFAFFLTILFVYFKHRPPTQNLHLTHITSGLRLYTLQGIPGRTRSSSVCSCVSRTLLNRDMHPIYGNWRLSFNVVAGLRIVFAVTQPPYPKWVQCNDKINHTHYKNSFQTLQLVTFYFTLFCLVYFILVFSKTGTALMNS